MFPLRTRAELRKKWKSFAAGELLQVTEPDSLGITSFFCGFSQLAPEGYRWRSSQHHTPGKQVNAVANE